MPSAGGSEIAVIEPGHPDVWAAETSAQRHGNVLVAHSVVNHVSGSSFALDRSKLRITVLAITMPSTSSDVTQGEHAGSDPGSNRRCLPPGPRDPGSAQQRAA
jgi:hypothetical protein